MDHFEIKAMRLEREQNELVGVIADMVDDIGVLIQYADCESMTPHMQFNILRHQKNAVRVMQEILEGK